MPPAAEVLARDAGLLDLGEVERLPVAELQTNLDAYVAADGTLGQLFGGELPQPVEDLLLCFRELREFVLVTEAELEALVRASDHHHRRHLKPAVGAEANAACCLLLRSEGELPPLLRNLLNREAVARERKLPVSVPDGLAVRALRKTPHKAGHGLKEAIRADASNSARHLLHPRHGVGVHEVGVLLIGLRKRLRRPELAAELPEVVRLFHLRVVDEHLRS